MARIGYARVSTIDQDLEFQQAKLKAEGCAIVRFEKVSGGSRADQSSRPCCSSCAPATSLWSHGSTGWAATPATCST